MILVSVPYFRNADWVETAVRSILGQTYRDIVCVVMGDGEEPPIAHMRDSRLIVHTLPENRGPYFAQTVSLEASPHAWYAPHAADDWSDPDHLERLMEFDTDVATGAVWNHVGRHVNIVRKQFEVGLFRTERLKAMGGYNPAERLGQDSLMMRLLRITGGVAASTHPTYHRVYRPGSLGNHPSTRKGSPAREAMRVRNRRVSAECERLANTDLIREYRWSLVPQPIRDELAEHTDRLRERLSA